jgi:hypothetical protein
MEKQNKIEPFDPAKLDIILRQKVGPTVVPAQTPDPYADLPQIKNSSIEPFDPSKLDAVLEAKNPAPSPEPVQLTTPEENGLLRTPTRSEDSYFSRNPNVSGMATSDNKVILNPYSKLTDIEKQAVIKNETARIIMRTTDLKPTFALTKEQSLKFKGYGSKQNIRETIVGRIISGDPSALNITDEQQNFANQVASKMEPAIQPVQRGASGSWEKPAPDVEGGLSKLQGEEEKALWVNIDEAPKSTKTLADLHRKKLKYLIPSTVTVGLPIPGLSHSFDTSKYGTRQEFTWAPSGEKGYAEQLWDKKQELVTRGVDYVENKAKNILGKDVYDSITETYVMQAAKNYIKLYWDINNAIIGTAMEMTEAATTPEGLAQMVLFDGILKGAMKVGGGAKVLGGEAATLKPKTGGIKTVAEAVAEKVNKVGQPVLDLWQAKSKRSWALTQKVINGFKPKPEDIKAAIDEVRQNMPVAESILGGPREPIPLSKELYDYQQKFGEAKSEIYPAPKDYAGKGVTRMDETLLNIKELEQSQRLKDTPIRDETMTLDDPMQYVNEERNVTKSPPISKDYQAFKESIAKEGVNEPVTVFVDKDGYIIVSDGTHRIAAAKSAGHNYIPAKVKYEGLSDQRFPRLGVDVNAELKGLTATKGEKRGIAYKTDQEMNRMLAEEKPEPTAADMPEALKSDPIIRGKEAKPIALLDNKGNIPSGNWELPEPKMTSEADLLPKPPTKWWKSKDVSPSRSSATLEVMSKLKTALGFGKIRVKDAAGIFKPDVTVIRSKEAFNPATISHELGHRVADILYDEYPKGKLKVNPELSKYSYELDRLAYKGAENLTDEGFAEFIRTLMIEPKKAKTMAPDFYEHFVNKMQTKPELWAALSKFQRAMHGFEELSPVGRVHSLIKPQSVSGKVTWFKDMIQKFRDDPRMAMSDLADEIGYQWFNDLGHTDRVLRSIGGDHAIRLYKDDPVILLRLLGRGKAGRIRAALETGLFDDNYNMISEPLHNVLKDVSRPFKDAETGKNYPGMFDEGGFWDYATIRRAIEFEMRFQSEGQFNGKAIGIPLHILQRAFDMIDNPTYRNVFDRSRKFKRTLDFRTHVLDIQDLTAKEFDVMFNANLERLFPFSRIMDEGVRHLEIKGKAGVRIMKARGSGRDLIHPYESMVKEINNQIIAADQAVSERKLADYCGTVKGGGGVFEHNPRRTKEIIYHFEEIKASAKKAIKEKIGDVPETLDEFDVLMDNIADSQGKLYRAGKLGPMERVIFRNGKPEVWEYKDQWIRDSFIGADTKTTGVVMNLMKISAKVARFGITVLNPDFMLKNWLRDTGTRFINTEGNPTAFIPDMAKALFESFRGTSEEYKLYQASGGPLSGLYGSDLNSLKLEMRKMDAGNLRYLRRPWQAIIDFNAYIEDFSRFVEFKAGYGKQKARSIAENIKRGETSEQALKTFNENPLRLQKREAVLRGGLAAREGTIDFLTSGKAAREYNKVTAFFTANIGGIRKIGLMLKEHPQRTILRGIGTLTIPTISLYLINRLQPEYENMDDYERWSFFHLPIGNGKFAKFPKPPGWGWMFSTQVEEFLRWQDKNNPNSELMKNLTKSFMQDFPPTVVPNAAQGFMAFTTGIDWFRGIGLESAHDKQIPAYMRSNNFTTETAKALAFKLKDLPKWKVLDLVKSPKLFEGVGRVQFGGMFKTALNVGDLVGYGANKIGLTDRDSFNKLPVLGNAPIMRSVVSMPRYRSATLANDFYDKLAEINQAHEEIKILGKQHKTQLKADQKAKNKILLKSYWKFNATARDLTDLNNKFKEVEMDNKISDEKKHIKLIGLGNKINAKYRSALDKLKGQ